MIEPRVSRLEVVYPDCFFDEPASGRDLSGLESIGRINDGEVYASPDVIVEVIRAQALGGLGLGNVYHATSSAALPAIARHGALLSSKYLMERGEGPTTGEINTLQGSVHKAWGGLDDVYASLGPTSTTYSFAAEGDYPVVFGIKTSALTNGHSIRTDNGDGIRLGNRVPLESVMSLTVPYDRLPEAQAWSIAHCQPDTLALSQEATFVLTSGMYVR